MINYSFGSQWDVTFTVDSSKYKTVSGSKGVSDSQLSTTLRFQSRDESMTGFWGQKDLSKCPVTISPSYCKGKTDRSCVFIFISPALNTVLGRSLKNMTTKTEWWRKKKERKKEILQNWTAEIRKILPLSLSSDKRPRGGKIWFR